MSRVNKARKDNVPSIAKIKPPEGHNLRSRCEMAFPIWNGSLKPEGPMLLPSEGRARQEAKGQKHFKR
jgi:hypothetical protein